jgi:hypothetical protein
VEAPNVIAFPTDRQTAAPIDTHPLVKSVTEVMTSLGNFARQVEKWPMEPEAKMRMLHTIRGLALQACELQLAAVTEVTDAAKFRSDLDRVMTALRMPEV